MGGSQSFSQEKIDELTHSFFTALPEKYINVGIDDSLLKYSGPGSTAVLNDYSSELHNAIQDNLPNYIEQTGSALAGFAAIPHAVGVGALIISMVLQMAFFTAKGLQSNEEHSGDMLRRIFAEEKASEVRDLMEEYLKRYKMHLRAKQMLLDDTRHLERSLSHQLTRLRNSMLIDGHMKSRALKHWANGAAFHAQMLIHMARLQKKDHVSFQTAKNAASGAIDTYNQDTLKLLKKYKEYKTSTFELDDELVFCETYSVCDRSNTCYLNDADLNRRFFLRRNEFCDLSPQHHYIDYIFSNHPQIIKLKSYFLDLQKDLSDLCNEEGTFQIRT